MKVKIKVTQEHIDQGYRGNCVYCPIAKALQEQLSDAWMVGGSAAWKYVYGGMETSSLPRSARRFIRRFDDYKPVQPFNFMLVVPNE